MSLYSARLIDYIREAGVQFESFPVTMIDRKTKQTLPVQYALFHLLEMQSGLDKDRSDIDEAKIEIRKLVLTEECLKTKRPLFRLKEYAPVVLMHQDLKDVLESTGISGCKFIPVDEFRVGMRFYFEKIANRERPQN